MTIFFILGKSSAKTFEMKKVNNIKNIYSTETSFAALKRNQNVVTWGEIKYDNKNSNIINISNGFNYYKGNYRYQKA